MFFGLRICERIVHGVWVACMVLWRLAVQLLSTGVHRADFLGGVQRSISPRLYIFTVCRATSEPARCMSNLRSYLSLAVSRFLALAVREITARSLEEWLMIRCGDTRSTVPCIASQAPLCSALDSGQRWDWLLHVWQMVSARDRLWPCRANQQYRLQLNSLVPAAVSFPDFLPHTLARTRIPRASWDVLSLEELSVS